MSDQHGTLADSAFNPDFEVRPDRAEEVSTEDRLDRDGFVTRLARALVKRSGQARGTIIGLTGPWGTGKSTVLKFLTEKIRSQHPLAAVVRFDPWMVSGRDDIISQFFAELLATIKEVGTDNGRNGEALQDLANKLAGYVKDLGPVADLFVPGAGKQVAAGAKVLERLTTRDTSLAKQKAALDEMLRGVKIPIIVLIDELDRVEDAEVRAVAQLVRAVADFPGISYLLAYDRARVVEALGDKNKERGEAYLEKIVQIEIPLPFSNHTESETMFVAEFERAAPTGLLPPEWRSSLRYRRLMAIARRDGLLITPRDIRRICGAYAVLAPMVEDEVDWVDLLGYTILLAKAPSVVDTLRRQPGLVIHNANQGQSFDEAWDEFSQAGNRDIASQNLAALKLTSDAPVRRLISFLFPLLRSTEDQALFDNEEIPQMGLRNHQPLMTVLRLGAVPGTVSRAELASWLLLDGGEKRAGLTTFHKEGRALSFLNRLLADHSGLVDAALDQTLSMIGMAPLLMVADPETDGHVAFRACEAFNQFCSQVTTKESLRDGGNLAQEVLSKLIADGVYDAPSLVLHRHGFPSGGGMLDRNTGSDWLGVSDANPLTEQLCDAIARSVLESRWRKDFLTPMPLVLASEFGPWKEPRQRLTDELAGNEDALRAWTVLFYGDPDRRGEKKRIHKIVDSDIVAARLRSVTPELWSSRTAAFALKKAREGLGVR